MLVSARVLRCVVPLCAAFSLGASGCAGGLSSDETAAEIDRLRAEVRQSEARVVAMQAQQAELTQQLRLLSAVVGAMANEVQARRTEMVQKNPSFPVNAPNAPAMPPEPPKPKESPDLEF